MVYDKTVLFHLRSIKSAILNRAFIVTAVAALFITNMYFGLFPSSVMQQRLGKVQQIYERKFNSESIRVTHLL